MTVLDANNKLFEWFRENHSFEMIRDLRKVLPIMEDEEETNIAFKLALEELEASGLIASKDYAEKKYYILTKPFDAYVQTVEIPSWTSQYVANEINEFCDLIDDHTDQCVGASLTDKDVRNLVHISQYFKSKLTEKEEIISTLTELSDLDDNDEDDENKKGKKKK